MTSTRKTSKGRRKIEIERIDNDHARQVCFCKRRKGLFKKASDLSVLCGTEVGVLVFSPGGKPFSFSHPSFDRFIGRFAAANIRKEPAGPIWWKTDVETLGLEELLAFERSLVELRRGLHTRTVTAADRASVPKADLAIVPYGMPAPTSSSVSPM